MTILRSKLTRNAAAFLVALRVATGQQHVTPTFDQYAAKLENRLAQQHMHPSTYIAMRMDRELRAGDVLVEAVDGGARPVRGGLLHHWRGAAFVPGARADDMIALLRDYRNLPKNYAPQLESCHVISERGDVTNLAMRLQFRKFVTVVLDANYEVRTGWTGDGRGYGISRSTRVQQIDDAGTKMEHARPPEADDAFLWRLNSYWSFLEVNGGLLIELETISLTRDVPVGLGWLVLPAMEQVPRESLGFTLRATAKALTARTNQEAHR